MIGDDEAPSNDGRPSDVQTSDVQASDVQASDVRASDSLKKRKKLGPFEKLGLSPQLCRAVWRVGYRLPTPIQRKAIPAILRNEGDVIGMGRTGSGKTAAFLLPLVQRLKSHSEIFGARGLILSPTRELALQTGKALIQLIWGTDLHLCYLVGGQSIEKQFDHLSKNPDVLIATPGRLIHHIIETGYKMTRVECVILDEADRLFEVSMVGDIYKIMDFMTDREGGGRVRKQFVLMSATLPTCLVEFSKLNLINTQLIQLDKDNILNETLKMQFHFVRRDDKVASLVYWIANFLRGGSALIFCATAHHVNFLSELLHTHFRIESACLFGNLSQTQREEAINSFKQGVSKILLCTDVAARGVDIKGLDYVVNYDFPTSSKLFVHRSGRTARNKAFGTVVSFITKEDLPYGIELMLFLGKKFKTAGAHETEVENIPPFPLESQTEISQFSDPRTCTSIFHHLVGFPSEKLNKYRGITRDSLEKDLDLARLYNSMLAGHREYLRFRPSASKMSVKRSKDLLEAAGGSQKLADSLLLPSVTTAPQVMKTSRVDKEQNGLGMGLGDIFGDTDCVKYEEPRGAAFVKGELIDLSTIRDFRPGAVDGSRGMGVSLSSSSGMKSILSGRVALREALRDGEEDKGNCKASELKEVMKLVTATKKSECPSTVPRTKPIMPHGHVHEGAISAQYKVPDFRDHDRARIIEKEFAVNTLDGNVLDLIPEVQSEMRKTKYVMKWNPVKKKYEVSGIDPLTRRKVKRKNDSGVVVHGEVTRSGIYRKWSKQTQKVLTRVGEKEDSTNCFIPRRERLKRLEMSISSKTENEGETKVPLAVRLEKHTRDLGLLEKMKRNVRLSHKEKRKVIRITKRSKMELVRGEDSNVMGTRSFEEMKQMKLRKLRNEEKARSRKQKRRSRGSTKAEFMARKNIEIFKGNRMTRSFILKRKKKT